MKINKMSKLGRNLVNKGNERRAEKANGNRFELSRKEMIEHGVNMNIVKDKLGVVMTTMTLGDMIAETIRIGMNVCALDMKKFVNEDGVLGDNAKHIALISAETFWQVYDKEIKTLDFNKLATILEARKGSIMYPIYTEEDIVELTNKYNMKRSARGVTDYYFDRARQALLSINKETTLKELEKFQKDFTFLTRGLGEQTIDVSKHIAYTFIVNMKNLISGYITVIGGIKELNSNIKTYKRDKEQYTITAPEEEVSPLKMGRQSDCIGNLMQASVDVMEADMREYIEILENESNYDNYRKYESFDLLSDPSYFKIAILIDTVEDAVMSMSVENRERALAGIYNYARQLGVAKELVFDIAMSLAISTTVKDREGNIDFMSVLGTDNEYKADIWKVAMLFGDVFVAEYTDKEYIEVEVDYETEIDIEEGEIIDIVDGYGYCGMLHIISEVFTDGKVEVKDGKVVALYNPLETILNRYSDAIVIPVDSYAKSICRFSQWDRAVASDFDNEEEIVGFQSLLTSRAIKVLQHNDEILIISVDKNGQQVAAAKGNSEIEYNSPLFFMKDAICYKSLIVASYRASEFKEIR